jgi:hypothetical protein
MNGLSDLRMVGSQHMMRRLGRPSTSCDDAHVAQVRKVVRSNRPLTGKGNSRRVQHIDRIML